MGEPGGLQSMGSQRVRQDWATFFLSIVPFGGGNGNPLQCSCLENPMDRGAWWGCSLWGCNESDMSKQLTHTHTHIIWSVNQIKLTLKIKYNRRKTILTKRWWIKNAEYLILSMLSFMGYLYPTSKAEVAAWPWLYLQITQAFAPPDLSLKQRNVCKLGCWEVSCWSLPLPYELISLAQWWIQAWWHSLSLAVCAILSQEKNKWLEMNLLKLHHL